MAKTVIDVSQFNGTVNWPAVNVDAAIIRLGYRGYGKAGTLVTDSKFEANYQGAAAAGIPVGVYWLSQATSDAEAEAEAAYVAQKLAGKNIAYPVYLDSEYSNNAHTGRADGISKARRTQYAVTFLEGIKAAGYTPGVYASESWYKDMLELSKLTGYTLWVAKYSSAKPSIGVSYDAWQYSDKGRPAGLPGNTDMSYFYRDFAAVEPTASAETEVDIVTQAEFDTMMDDYLSRLGQKEPSSWSQTAREWAEGNSIINGDEAGRKKYKKFCTREEIAQILYNMQGK